MRISKEIAKEYIQHRVYKPTTERVNYYNNIRNNAIHMTMYQYQERCLDDFFSKFPKNNSLESTNKEEIIRMKCLLVDRYYSTNLKEGLDMAVENILSDNINFDYRLSVEDISLVDSIKTVYSKRAKNHLKNSLSFASKYCSRHYPSVYPIYDEYVREMLYYLNEVYSFCDGHITVKSLENNYIEYKQVIDKFISNSEFFGEYKPNYKEIDNYLWTWAKEILRNNE